MSTSWAFLLPFGRLVDHLFAAARPSTLRCSSYGLLRGHCTCLRSAHGVDRTSSLSGKPHGELYLGGRADTALVRPRFFWFWGLMHMRASLHLAAASSWPWSLLVWSVHALVATCRCPFVVGSCTALRAEPHSRPMPTACGLSRPHVHVWGSLFYTPLLESACLPSGGLVTHSRVRSYA